MQKSFFIEGMSCSACSLGIEKAISKLNGINKVNVSLISKEMLVEFDENILSEQLILATVEGLGYSISSSNRIQKDKYNEAKKLKKRFCLSLIILIPLMYLCLGKILGLLVPDDKINFSIQFVLALSILIINRKFFINGTKAALKGSPNMDTLISLGSASAFIYSLIMTVLFLLNKRQINHVFFDSSAMVLCLVTLGKWIEEVSKIKTGDAVEKLGKLIPKSVTIIKDDKEEIVLTSSLKVGDKIIFRAGDYVAVDGKIIDGHASIDKSIITGESLPEEISLGNNIFSGAIVKNGYIIVLAEKVGDKALFNQIVEMVKVAGASKAPIQKFADKVAGIFVPIVTIIAILTFVVWIILSNDLYKAFNFAISVLVISCPCSLGLATPVAVMAGAGKAASMGILFKDAAALQNTCKLNCILLDKTATITVGEPKVTDFINLSQQSEREIFSIVSALEERSSHPLSQSIINYCGKSALSVDEYEYIIGKGIVGEIYGEIYYIGNENLIPNIDKKGFSQQNFTGKTLIYFANEFELLAIFALTDCIKEDSKLAISKLKEKHIKLVMLTGDNEETAKYVASEVGLDEYYANVLPQDKFNIVNKYKNNDYYVAMVGDGINDSPALKGADIGISIGSGTDIAIDSSDIVLANNSLMGLNNAINLSKKSVKIIKQNLFWAFFYNSIGIPIAFGALSFVGIILSPIIASALMSCSSLFVVMNALRLARGERQSIDKNIELDSCDEYLSKTIKIEGMMCSHCVKKIKDALLSIKDIRNVQVSLEKGLATFEYKKGIDINIIVSAINNIGFKIKE